MGNCSSSPAGGPEEQDAIRRNKEIENTLSFEKKSMMAKGSIKLLLLGAGDTGKSTVLKQFRLIYGVGFTEQEKALYRSAIILNIINSTTTLMNAMDKLKIPYGFDASTVITQMEMEQTSATVDRNLGGEQLGTMPSLKKSNHSFQSNSCLSQAISVMMGSKMSLKEGLFCGAKDATAKYAEYCYSKKMHTGEGYNASLVVKDMRAAFGIDPVLEYDLLTAIKILWSDPGIKYCFSRSGEYQISDTCAYFLNDVERFCDPSYEPNDQDILNCRVMTLTITETKFEMQNVIYRVFDVGGQRSERKKWAPYFDDVSAIIYLVAISSFDQMCLEDESTNRMVESLNLFGSVCNHPVFKKTSLILFMNKIDIFKEKLKTTQVSTYFPDFNGSNDYNPTSQYFSMRFLAINKYPEKSIYTHFTWATDTKQIKHVLETVREIIAKTCLAALGFL
ncbi:guanine nucleotide binding protein, alpha subunit [Obelidium mucronatum]|nr:guanine nucleotide binding protein, alpha subunit [Obelidium mucronatum]